MLKILAIGSHPDDIEFGCGGALIKFADLGHEVYLLVMTDGGRGGVPAVRMEEQERSGEILGVKRIFYGGYPDTQLVMDTEVIRKIESVISEVDPDYIFCHFPDDTHQDHRHLARATISATRYVRNVLFYEVPTTQHFDPSVFVDISDTIQRKLQALEAHGSQVTKTNIEDHSIVTLARAGANFRGIQGRIKNAEAFGTLRLFIDIPEGHAVE